MIGSGKNTETRKTSGPMKTNEALEIAMQNYNRRKGPKVGEIIAFPNGTLHRITYDWGDVVQTAEIGFGSYHLGISGYMDYSGGLDSPVPKNKIQPTPNTLDVRVWTWRDNISGAGRGVYFDVPVKVYKLTGSDNYGRLLPHEVTARGYMLQEDQRRIHGDYLYLIYSPGHPASNWTAFRTRQELGVWISQHRLKLDKDPIPGESFEVQLTDQDNWDMIERSMR